MAWIAVMMFMLLIVLAYCALVLSTISDSLHRIAVHHERWPPPEPPDGWGVRPSD